MDLVIAFRCHLPQGLHARPASHLLAVCAPFLASIRWKNLRNGREADVRRPLAMLGTDTLFDDPCEIRIAGSDANAARARLERFLRLELTDDAGPSRDSDAVLAGETPSDPPRPIIDGDCVALGCRWQTPREAIAGMVRGLWLCGRLDGRSAMERTLWTREQQSATGVGFGIAIPHARSALVRHPTIAVAKLVAPIAWPSVDGRPVDTVIMLAMGVHNSGEDHLRLFSRLARSLVTDRFRERLAACTDRPAVLALMDEALAGEG
jgi:fructose-specific PTS system IIA-like component